jgi:predicted metal-dependent peptidase
MLEIDKAIEAVQDSDVFFMRIIATMKKILDHQTDTMSTDGKNLRYSPKFVHELIHDNGNISVQAIIVHEILHIAFKHHIEFAKELAQASKNNNRKHHRLINIACDLAINSFLVGRRGWPDGFYVPGQGEDPYRSFPLKKDARWYYNKIIKHYKDNPEERNQPPSDDGNKSGGESKENQLKVGSKVKINRTGQVGTITRINPDNTYEVDILSESTLQELYINLMESYSIDELTPINDSDDNGQDGGEDGQDGGEDGQDGGDDGQDGGQEGGEDSDGGQEGGQGGQGGEEDSEGGQGGEEDSEGGQEGGQGGQEGGQGGQGGQGGEEDSEGGQEGGQGGGFGDVMSTDDIEDLLPDEIVDGVPAEKTPGDIDTPPEVQGIDPDTPEFEKKLSEVGSKEEQDLKDTARESDKQNKKREELGRGRSRGTWSDVLDWKSIFEDKGKIPWQAILRKFLTQRSRSGTNWGKPSKRNFALNFSDFSKQQDGQLFEPRKEDKKLNELMLLVDVSASNKEAAEKVFPEIREAINSSGFGKRSSLRLVSFDAGIQDEFIITKFPSRVPSLRSDRSHVPEENIFVPKRGKSFLSDADMQRFKWVYGGSTEIGSVLEAINKLPQKPPFVVVLTDGEFYGNDPEYLRNANFQYEIIWIMTQDNGEKYKGTTYNLYEME